MSLENDIKKNIIKENNNNSINIKLLLSKLLQSTLDSSILKLESKSSNDFSSLKLISKNFNEFSKEINVLKNKLDETIKKREKEKLKKPSKRNDKKKILNNKKRTLRSNSIKALFNKKRNNTMATEDEFDKIKISKNYNNIGRRKISQVNKLGLRTISDFRTIQVKQKEKEKETSKENVIEIEGYKKQKKLSDAMNLKKYKTSLNKNIFKKIENNNIQGANSLINNINKIGIKKNDISWMQLNNSVKNSKIIMGINYSFDKLDGNIINNNGISCSLSDIEETIGNTNNNLRKNNFKNKEEKNKIKNNILNDKNKLEIRIKKKQNSINNKIQNIIGNENLKKKDIWIENNSNTISTDQDIRNSKIIINKNPNLNNINKDKKENRIFSVENIVKLVDDVNQNINKILVGSQTNQSHIQRRREESYSFIDKKGEIIDLINKSKENNLLEKEKTTIFSNSKQAKLPQINNNILLSNENNSKKNYKKIKINNNNTNNDYSSSKKNYNKKEIIKCFNYNSTKNKTKKSIKKIILHSNENKSKELEKKIEDININQNLPLNFETKKLNNINNNDKEEKDNKITFLNLIQNNSKILQNILQYLSFKNKINFLSTNKYLSKERISLLVNKKEALILILQLKENETIEDKIKKLKNNSNNSKEPTSKLIKEFKLSKDVIRNLKQLNEAQNIKLFKEKQINKNKITEINIIYKILLLLLGEKKLVEISDDYTFWKKCCKYFLDKSEGKIGNCIINQVKNFCFDHQTINLIEFTLIGNKNNILNGYYEKLCKTTGLIIPLIKQAFEYCGITTSDNKYNPRILDNLKYNQMLINKLDIIINFYSGK